MAITEEERHRLYLRLEEVLGREQAATLMEHLPPVGWADVATKRDLDQLASATKRDLDHLEGTLRSEIRQQGDQLRAEWRKDLNQQTFLLLGAIAAMAGAMVAAVRI